MTAPYRPLLRYHGGKWRLATWINKAAQDALGFGPLL